MCAIIRPVNMTGLSLVTFVVCLLVSGCVDHY